MALQTEQEEGAILGRSFLISELRRAGAKILLISFLWIFFYNDIQHHTFRLKRIRTPTTIISTLQKEQTMAANQHRENEGVNFVKGMIQYLELSGKPSQHHPLTEQR